MTPRCQRCGLPSLLQHAGPDVCILMLKDVINRYSRELDASIAKHNKAVAGSKQLMRFIWRLAKGRSPLTFTKQELDEIPEQAYVELKTAKDGGMTLNALVKETQPCPPLQ